MLSIAPIKDSEQALDYFSPAEYYQPNELDEQSVWFGEGATALGLTGDVDLQQFKALLDGKVAGHQLGKTNKDGELEHQAGWDLTFSAPKSLSILTMIGDDKRLIEAHQAAVKTALGVVEQEFTKTRIRVSREQVIEANTESLVIAQFLHSLSRENDPQLHTHCVVVNATQRSDGQWRSLNSPHFYDHKMLVGQIYRNELALLVKKLGYQLDIDHRSGLFEIKGIPRNLIECFSKRREEIESVAESQDAREMERATLFTRKNKRKQSALKLMTGWVGECKAAGFKQSRVKKVIECSIAHVDDLSAPMCGKRSVEQAIDHLSKKEAVFSKKHLCEASLKLGLGEIDYQAIKASVQEQQQSQSIVPSSLVVRGRVATAYTTPNAASREQYIIKLLKQGSLAKNKMSHRYQVDEQIKDSQLSQGQKAAIQLIMTSKNQFLGIQGYAGVGKTTMLKSVKLLIENAGYQLRAYAPTHAAVDALQNETGIESRTLASFLQSMENKQVKGKAVDCTKEVWIVDEASLIGTKDMANLLTCARAAKSRVVLLGDKSQLGSVSWGKPFHLMMQNGMSCAVMKEIQRQKVEQLKTAVKESIKANSYSISWPFISKNPIELLKKQLESARNDIDRSLASLSSDVVEIENKKERQQGLINYFSGLNAKERDNCLVIIPDNQSRHELMPFLRAASLQDLPNISVEQDSIKTTILCEIDCPNTTHAQCYGVGEVVEFSKTYKKAGIRAGDQFYIKGINGKTNTVLITPVDGSGNIFEWDPEKIAGKSRQGVTLLKEYERSLMIGEKIVFNKSDKQLGCKNGDRALVTKINNKKNEITAKLENGKKVTFNFNKFRQYDHGYATTAYKAQGKTVNQVVILAESYRENLMTQKSFYVALSRAKFHAKIFTDNKEYLSRGLSERPGHKTSSLEQDQMKNAIDKILEKNSQKTKEPFKEISISV